VNDFVSQSVLIFEPFGAKPRKDEVIPTSDRAALSKHYNLLCM